MNRALRQVVWLWLGLFALAALVWLTAMALKSPADAQEPPVTENLVSGSNSATGTSATTIISAPSATRRIYVTNVQCFRSDAGTTATTVTLNDTASTVIGLPNSGGGGGNNMIFTSPLTMASATALTFTSSASLSTVYCNAQGFTGN